MINLSSTSKNRNTRGIVKSASVLIVPGFACAGMRNSIGPLSGGRSEAVVVDDAAAAAVGGDGGGGDCFVITAAVV